MNNTNIEEFTKELVKRTTYVTGEGQYGNDGDSKDAYRHGFQDALCMVVIDLTGSPKTEGMLSRYGKACREEEHSAWMKGKRCIACGEEKEADALSEMCPDCWEEA